MTEMLKLTFATHACRDIYFASFVLCQNQKRNLSIIQRCSKGKYTLNYPVNNFAEASGCGWNCVE
jgi:hypothetical protein